MTANWNVTFDDFTTVLSMIQRLCDYVLCRWVSDSDDAKNSCVPISKCQSDRITSLCFFATLQTTLRA
jgi:hypothetical protein